MPFFRKKPVIIEAIQWTGSNVDEILAFVLGKVSLRRKDFKTETGIILGGVLIIETLEGDHNASPNDWIIKGTAGEFYPCKPDIFINIYEPANA